MGIFMQRVQQQQTARIMDAVIQSAGRQGIARQGMERVQGETAIVLALVQDPFFKECGVGLAQTAQEFATVEIDRLAQRLAAPRDRPVSPAARAGRLPQRGEHRANVDARSRTRFCFGPPGRGRRPPCEAGPGPCAGCCAPDVPRYRTRADRPASAAPGRVRSRPGRRATPGPSSAVRSESAFPSDSIVRGPRTDNLSSPMGAFSTSNPVQSSNPRLAHSCFADGVVASSMSAGTSSVRTQASNHIESWRTVKVICPMRTRSLAPCSGPQGSRHVHAAITVGPLAHGDFLSWFTRHTNESGEVNSRRGTRNPIVIVRGNEQYY